MGLGKTLQAIAFLSYLKCFQKSHGPFLVLCPLSITDGWVSEIEKYAVKLRVLRYVGEKEQRRSLRRKIQDHVLSHSTSSAPEFPFDVLLTTYDIALLDQDFLSQFSWHFAVIDEAQRLKNPFSVIQLQKACSHPYFFYPSIEPEPYEEVEHLVQASGKLIILDQILQKLHSLGHCVLVFAQMTHTLDVLQDFLELRKYSYERLDGSIRAEERFVAIRNLSMSQARGNTNSTSDESGAFVFLISTRAGGVGLNLVAADTTEENHGEVPSAADVYKRGHNAKQDDGTRVLIGKKAKEIQVRFALHCRRRDRGEHDPC